MKQPTKLIRDGLVAVLYSPGFGAGWSTWSTNDKDFLLFDEGLVRLAETSATMDVAEAYLKENGIDDYMGGWRDIKIAWLPVGCLFHVVEYDGSEAIEERNKLEWSVA
jgi:hypothetical protein